jgi:hypothetical protein
VRLSHTPIIQGLRENAFIIRQRITGCKFRNVGAICVVPIGVANEATNEKWAGSFMIQPVGLTVCQSDQDA